MSRQDVPPLETLHAPCAAKIRKNIYIAFIHRVKKYVSV